MFERYIDEGCRKCGAPIITEYQRKALVMPQWCSQYCEHHADEVRSSVDTEDREELGEVMFDSRRMFLADYEQLKWERNLYGVRSYIC
jgi:hypothetical protein